MFGQLLADDRHQIECETGIGERDEVVLSLSRIDNSQRLEPVAGGCFVFEVLDEGIDLHGERWLVLMPHIITKTRQFADLFVEHTARAAESPRRQAAIRVFDKGHGADAACYL